MSTHTRAELTARYNECARIKAFLKRKGSSASCSVPDATAYAEAAALIDAYLDACVVSGGALDYFYGDAAASRLMAAAPDLLALVQAIHADQSAYQWRAACAAAVAKATGEP